MFTHNVNIVNYTQDTICLQCSTPCFRYYGIGYTIIYMFLAISTGICVMTFSPYIIILVKYIFNSGKCMNFQFTVQIS